MLGAFEKYSGDDLLSQGVSPQVPSARAGLTAVFGMGTGVSPPPWSPEIFSVDIGDFTDKQAYVFTYPLNSP